MKRKLICLAVAAAVLVALGWWIRHLQKRSPIAQLPDSNTPEARGIRFLGVQVHGCDDLLDANGRKIGEMLAFVERPNEGDPPGAEAPEAEDLRRRFVFELPKTAEPMLFCDSPLIRTWDGDLIECGGSQLQQVDCPDRRLLLCTLDFSGARTAVNAWGLSRPVEEPFDRVDLTVRFYHGPPGECAVSFPALFPPGKTLLLRKDGHTYTLTVSSRGQRRQRNFTAEADYPLDIGLPVLLYDKHGKRRVAKPRGWNLAETRTLYECDLGEMSWEEVARIVVAEQPQRRTFRNIAIRYRDRSVRKYADSTYRMAEILNRPVEDVARGILVRDGVEEIPEYGAPSDPAHVADALKVMDVVRGDQIGEVCGILLRAGPADLPAEKLPAVRETAASWAGAPSSEAQLCGAKLGMRVSAGDEFLAVALRLMDSDEGNTRAGAAGAIGAYYQKPTPQGVQQITQRLLAKDDRWVLARLLAWLAKNDSPETTEALWELAAADQDRPWLWLRAMEALNARKAAEDRASLEKKLRLRLILAAGPREGEEDLAAEAYRMLPALLRPECIRMDPKLHAEIYSLLAKHTDRVTGTKTMVEFLRRLDPNRDGSNWAVRPIQQLNLWHDMNFGRLGSDLSQNAPRSFPEDCPAIIDEVLRWHDSPESQQQTP